MGARESAAGRETAALEASGPGATNTVTVIATACLDSIPPGDLAPPSN